MSIDWKIDRPLRVGDTVRSRARTAVKRSMRDGGVVIEEHELVDQHGDGAPARPLHVPRRQAGAI